MKISNWVLPFFRGGRGLCLVTVALAASAVAQVPANYQNDKGFTSYASFSGSSNSLGQVYKLDSNIGYNLSEHLGFDVGVPVYFVRPSSTTTQSTSSNGLGDPYVDMRLSFTNPVVNYGSQLTGYLPVADALKGFSTGRVTFDWTNRFDRSFGRLTPFVEAGIANTTPDSQFFNRPYTSLGFNSHFRGGASVDMLKFFNVGAAAYAIVPSGQQKIFSRNVAGGTSGNPAAGGHGRVFQTAHEITGPADIARDNGYSAWVGAHPSPYLDLELAYTRSVPLALNTVSFSIGVNIGSLTRRVRP